jgi:biopolymer transport protein ExbB/TolQ
MVEIVSLLGIAAAFFLIRELYTAATAHKQNPSWKMQSTSGAFPDSSDLRNVPKQAMEKNIYDVIGQKETQLERLMKELQVLCTVAPMLEEDSTPQVQAVQGSDLQRPAGALS